MTFISKIISKIANKSHSAETNMPLYYQDQDKLNKIVYEDSLRYMDSKLLHEPFAFSYGIMTVDCPRYDIHCPMMTDTALDSWYHYMNRIQNNDPNWPSVYYIDGNLDARKLMVKCKNDNLNIDASKQLIKCLSNYGYEYSRSMTGASFDLVVNSFNSYCKIPFEEVCPTTEKTTKYQWNVSGPGRAMRFHFGFIKMFPGTGRDSKVDWNVRTKRCQFILDIIDKDINWPKIYKNKGHPIDTSIKFACEPEYATEDTLIQVIDCMLKYGFKYDTKYGHVDFIMSEDMTWPCDTNTNTT